MGPTIQYFANKERNLGEITIFIVLEPVQGGREAGPAIQYFANKERNLKKFSRKKLEISLKLPVWFIRACVRRRGRKTGPVIQYFANKERNLNKFSRKKSLKSR